MCAYTHDELNNVQKLPDKMQMQTSRMFSKSTRYMQ